MRKRAGSKQDVSEPLLDAEASASTVPENGAAAAEADVEAPSDQDPVMARKKNKEKPGKAQKDLSSFAAKYRGEGAAADDGGEDAETVVLQLEQSLLNAPIQTAKQLLTPTQREPFGNTALEGLSAEHEHLKQVRERSHKAHRMRIRARRVAVARFWGEVTLSVSLAIAAFVVWFVDRRDGEHHKAWGIPIFTWLIAGAVVLPILALVKLLVRVGTYLLEVVLCRVYENVQYVLISLRGGLTVLLSTVALKGVVEYLVASAPGSPKGLPKALDQVTLCFVIFAFVELAKTLLARLLSLRLHSDALFDEIEDSFKVETVLGKLMAPITAGELRERSRQIAAARSIPEAKVAQYLQDTYQLSLPVDSTEGQAFTARMAKLIRQFESMSEPELDTHAAHAAEYFWWTCRQNVNNVMLLKRSLQAKLHNEDDATFAFELFDVDGDGYVLEEEVHTRFKHIYRERRDVAITLANTEVVLATLTSLVGCVLHAAAIFLYLYIFGVDVHQLVISLSSMTLALAFVFGNSLRTVYESVVFLFIVRPYKVGDWILYAGVFHQVRSFGLLWTQLCKYDGVHVAVPNQTLMASDIKNVTESDTMKDFAEFTVDAKGVTPAMVHDLAERVHQMMQGAAVAHLFDQDTHPHAAISSVADPFKFNISLMYRLSNTEEMWNRCEDARTEVSYVIAQWLEDNGMHHTTSMRPITNCSLDEGGKKKAK